MPRLLIQCQGSPGPLRSLTVGAGYAASILQRYHRVPEQTVISIATSDNETYYINLALVSWICVVDESEVKPKIKPDESGRTLSGTGLSQETLNTIDNIIQGVRDDIIRRCHDSESRPSYDPPEL